MRASLASPELCCGVMGGFHGVAVRVAKVSWTALLLGFAVLQSCGKSSADDDATSGGVSSVSGGASAGGGSGASNELGGRSGQGGAVGTTGGTSTEGGTDDATAGAAGEVGTGGRAATGGASSGGTSGLGGGINVSAGGSAGGVSKCTGITVVAEPVRPVLEFLVDTSGSMVQKVAGTTSTRYEVTRDALRQAFEEMPDGTGAGLLFYPNVLRASDVPCLVREEAVPIGVLDAQLRQALDAALVAKRVLGNTPTHDALLYALEKLGATSVDGPKYLVLLTDGAPTFSLGCVGNGVDVVDSAPLVQEIQSARLTAGIGTFVIGSPGSEEVRSSLSQMATAGGTAPAGCSDQGPTYCHLDMTVAPDLALALGSALRSVTDSTKSCSYHVPLAPNFDPTLVNVSVTTAAGAKIQVPKSTGPTCTSGWQYSTNTEQIILCPSTCEAAKADRNARVELILGCRSI